MRVSLETELAAASAVAARAGLGDTQPRVLKLAHHTTVHLAPTAIVARIQPGGRSRESIAKLERELAVAAWLAARDAPTVRPASKISAGPFYENGCAITLWQFVDGRPAESDEDAVAAARALKFVHQALDAMAVGLPSFTLAFESCEDILFDASKAPRLGRGDRDFLQEIYREFRAELDRHELRCRPLHGDAHLGNVLVTGSGVLWMDLDDVCTGPLEWDVACLPPRAWPEFPEHDGDLLPLLAAFRSLCVTAWCWADFDRAPDIREAATYHLDQLRWRFAGSPRRGD